MNADELDYKAMYEAVILRLRQIGFLNVDGFEDDIERRVKSKSEERIKVESQYDGNGVVHVWEKGECHIPSERCLCHPVKMLQMAEGPIFCHGEKLIDYFQGTRNKA